MCDYCGKSDHTVCCDYCGGAGHSDRSHWETHVTPNTFFNMI